MAPVLAINNSSTTTTVGTLTFSNDFTATNALTITNSGIAGATISGNITNTGGITINGSGNGTLTFSSSKSVSGAGGVTFNASNSTILFTGNNSYSGGTTLTSGTVQIQSSNNALGTGSLAVNGGTLDLYNKTLVVGELSGSGGVITSTHASSSASITANASTDSTYSGSINKKASGTGTVSLIKQGTGTLTLTGTNTYDGNTTITAGALQIGNGGTTGSLSSNSVITNNGTLVFNRSNTITQGNDFSTAAIGGTGGIIQQGNGTLVLNASNTYTGGTTINAGILNVTIDAALGAVPGSPATNITMNGGTLQYGAAFNLSANRSIVLNAGGGTIDMNGTNPTSYGNDISGVGALTISNSSGTASTFTMGAGNKTYTGGTTVNSNVTLKFSGVDKLPTSSNMTISGGTMDLQTQTQTYGNLVLKSSGTISATGAGVNQGIVKANAFDVQSGTIDAKLRDNTGNATLTKSTGGTVTLTGNNTYTGATAVNAGTLLINGNSTGSAFSVTNTGSTLGGNGTITPGASNALTVNSGAILAPGVNGTAGNLTLALNNTGDSATFATGAKFAFDLGAPGTSDVLAFTGLTATVHDVTFNSNVVDFTNLGGLAAGSYTLFTFNANDAYAGTLQIGSGLESFAGSSFSYNANNIVLNVVPEPATWALLALSLTTVMVLRRRRTV